MTDIKKLRELEKKATPPPWAVGVVVTSDPSATFNPFDGELIATVRNLLPEMLDEIERLRVQTAYTKDCEETFDAELTRLRESNKLKDEALGQASEVIKSMQSKYPTMTIHTAVWGSLTRVIDRAREK